MRAAQHSPASRDLRRAPFDTPYRAVRAGGSLRTTFGQSSRLCGLELVPIKWRCLVPGERLDGAQSRRMEPVEITSTPEEA